MSKVFHAREIGRLVEEIDAFGGPNKPAMAAYTNEFILEYETEIDQTLDPFSEAYVSQQLALYREIVGRDPDPVDTEQYKIAVKLHAAAAHPLNDRNLSVTAKHMAAISNVIALAGLPHAARVLDLGCGWGQTSEILAYCGAEVVAVDINPLFVDLVRQRAKRLGLPITAEVGTFEGFSSAEPFDMVFYYECLHHAIRPWVALEFAARHVKPEGLIAFAGEPLNALWWKHWGLRLDAISVYCIRKYGWFESGWSAEFLIACFERAGFVLRLHPGLGIEGSQVGIADRTGTIKRVSAFDRYVSSMEKFIGDLHAANANPPDEVGPESETDASQRDALCLSLDSAVGPSTPPALPEQTGTLSGEFDSPGSALRDPKGMGVDV
ncbi:class I SAM-dependent methyltransferase [Isosphaeraceae bacterium EP7]